MIEPKEVAQAVMKAYEEEDTYNFPIDGVVAALREVVSQLQYYQFCREEGVEDMVLDARAILDVCEELEKL
jgi:hypothetical protein